MIFNCGLDKVIPNPIMRSNLSMELEGAHNKKYHALYWKGGGEGEEVGQHTKFKAHGRRELGRVCI